MSRWVALCLIVLGCGRGGDPPPEATGSREATVTGPLTVLAAASLTETFTGLGKELERRHPGTAPRFSFGASSTLAAQAAQGAPADVLATADLRTMQVAVNAGVVMGEPVVFASNRLVIAVPPGNPATVRSLADLARPGVKVAVCAERVPCGAATERALAQAGVRLAPVTLERDVRAVLTKVLLDEVDAGLVYATDVRAAGDRVRAIPLPEAAGAVNEYAVAVLRQAPNPFAARAFVDLVQSDAGRSALTRAGFVVP